MAKESPDSNRERLASGLHQTETHESNVNEAFVEWLKNDAAWWVIPILLALCLYFLWNWYRDHQAEQRTSAWSAYTEAQQSQLPRAFEDIAKQYAGIDSVSHLARLRAGDLLLQAVQNDQPLGAASSGDNQSGDDGQGQDNTPTEMTADLREQYLNRAEGQYQAVLDADDGSTNMTLHAVNAMGGLAVVAEARGNVDKARQYYEQAAERAGESYPALANEMNKRLNDLEQVASTPTLPNQSDVPAPGSGNGNLTPAPMNPALQDILLADDSNGG